MKNENHIYYKTLSWKDIDKVQPIEVVAFTSEGGVFKLITRDKQTYISHGWQKSEIDKICNAYADILYSIRNNQPIRSDWMILNLGLGHYIYITSELRPYVRIRDISPSQIYRQWETYILEALTRLENHTEHEALINQARISPDHIDTLDDNEVIVFGSNIFGFHDAGVAELANRRFGAVYGKAEGHNGQSYAITTDGVAYGKTKSDIRNFIEYASLHPDLKFIVTKIGCGMAGYSPAQIAPLFQLATSIENILLPLEFWKFLN